MNEILLKKEFKEVEEKLLKILKSISIKDVEKKSHKEFVTAMKKHIKLVNEAKELFDQYEAIAKKLQHSDDVDDEAALEVQSKVVGKENLKKQTNLKAIETKSIKNKTKSKEILTKEKGC